MNAGLEVDPEVAQLRVSLTTQVARMPAHNTRSSSVVDPNTLNLDPDPQHLGQLWPKGKLFKG